MFVCLPGLLRAWSVVSAVCLLDCLSGWRYVCCLVICAFLCLLICVIEYELACLFAGSFACLVVYCLFACLLVQLRA